MYSLTRRSFSAPSLPLFTRLYSSSPPSSSFKALCDPPTVQSRRVVVTGKHAISLVNAVFHSGYWVFLQKSETCAFFFFLKGLGMVSPLGCGVETTWNRLIKGESGIRALSPDDMKMNGFDKETQSYTYDQLCSKVAAIVPCGTEPHHFNEQLWLNSKVL